ncbi:MAG: trypsin-like peptidase domain-containing protein [Thermoguttaceae bacterium]|nr:trypsin-like peptidase domain-containing protein [Thermoguttaceae bacterium]MBR0191956.1 trypsin-like peptidase domain-containing protein [Thermoguttaceae bacterium]
MSIPFLRTALALTALTFSPAVLYPSFCPGGRGCFFPPQSSTAPATDFRSEPAAPLPTVVRILVEAGNVQNYGTGTWIQLNADRNAVLTCAHLFVVGRSERITVYFPNLPPLPVRLLVLNREWDAALLTADAGAPPKSSLPKAVLLAQTPPRQGDFLRFCGYGPTGSFLWNLGTLRGYCRLPRTAGCCTMVLTGTARMGDSGGPIFTLDGHLAGVLWGTDDHCVYGTWAGKIRQVFDAEFQKVTPEVKKPQSRLLPIQKPRKKPRPKAAPPSESAVRPPKPNTTEPPKCPIPFSLLLILYFLAWLFPAVLAWRWMKKRREKASA